VLDAALKVDPVGLVVLTSSLAGACPGCGLAADVLERVSATIHKVAGAEGATDRLPREVIEGLLAAPLDGQRLWLLTGDALGWLVVQARCLQVMLCAHQPKLFRHFMTEGVAPELFFCNWLFQLFAGCAGDAEVVRLWDSFIFERSYKVFIRAAVALFGLVESKLRGDVDQIVEALFKPDQWGLEPGALWQRALETKMTRSMLNDVIQGERAAVNGRETA